MSQPLFQIKKTSILGCLEIRPRIHEDMRGRFVKVFQQDFFRNMGLCADFSEDFYSVSRCGVIRGLHFQTPPADHVKLVYCIEGLIQDAALDLRVDSPTFGRNTLVELSAREGNMLYIPSGLAHGFCTRSETAVVAYKASTPHSPEHDHGILWNSAGIPWSENSPLLSERDLALPPFRGFQTPFIYELKE